MSLEWGRDEGPGDLGVGRLQKTPRIADSACLYDAAFSVSTRPPDEGGRIFLRKLCLQRTPSLLRHALPGCGCLKGRARGGADRSRTIELPLPQVCQALATAREAVPLSGQLCSRTPSLTPFEQFTLTSQERFPPVRVRRRKAGSSGSEVRLVPALFREESPGRSAHDAALDAELGPVRRRVVALAL